MPTYEYECTSCGHEFEEFHSMTADSIKDCPNCDTKDSVKRLISAGAGIIFKGSGFYETDYKRKPEPPQKSDSSSSNSTSSTTGDIKTKTEKNSDKSSSTKKKEKVA